MPRLGKEGSATCTHAVVCERVLPAGASRSKPPVHTSSVDCSVRARVPTRLSASVCSRGTRSQRNPPPPLRLRATATAKLCVSLFRYSPSEETKSQRQFLTRRDKAKHTVPGHVRYVCIQVCRPSRANDCARWRTHDGRRRDAEATEESESLAPRPAHPRLQLHRIDNRHGGHIRS